MNLNKIFNSIANEQGVEVGSPQWISGGLHMYGGQTGSHPAYGWKHDHLINDEYVKYVIANYGHRRTYYDISEEEKKAGVKDLRYALGYEIAGRPHGWKPEDSTDLSNGQVTYLTSQGLMKVCGPDILHFHLGPLFAAYDSDKKVMAQGNMVSCKILAGVMIRYLVSSLAGQIRGGNFSLFNDRGASNVLHVAFHATARKLIDQDDLSTVHQWLIESFIPFYESGAGHHIEQKTAEPGKYKFQIYNGLYWLLPSLYDISSSLPEAPLKEKLDKIVKRFCQWMLDLYQVNLSLNVNQIYIPEEVAKGATPPESLKPYLSIESFIKSSTDWSLWGYRAASVAAKVLNSEDLTNACHAIYKKFSPKKENKIWLVNADGEYAVN